MISDSQLAKLNECFTEKKLSPKQSSVFTEKKVKFELINDDKESIIIIEVDIDNCLFKKLGQVNSIEVDRAKKCDYLIIVPDKSLEIWIELKGSDVEEGKKQLQQTLKNETFYQLLTQIIEKYYFKTYNKINQSVKKVGYVVYKRNGKPSENTKRQNRKKKAKLKSQVSSQKDKLMILEQKNNQSVYLSKLLT
ncbi:MAG: hypothetical protein QNJ37_10480 [Crocosphaera sp.]|nr:hypothetical protein [Crocosphaera sp.]